MPVVIIKDKLRSSVEAASGGQQTVMYDEKGNPTIMNIIPKFRYEDLDPGLGTGVCSAFIVGGKEKSEIFISTYMNTIVDGYAISAPGQKFSIVNRAAARAACLKKGPGWHLMTNHEWAAIAFWMAARNIKPTGNTYYGQSHIHKYETGVRFDKRSPGDTTSGGTPYTLTGSGPKEWNHDLSPNGIADIVGNCSEHVDLLELRDGRFYTTPDNNYLLTEDEWTAMDLYLDAKIAGTNDSTMQGNCGILFSDKVTKKTHEEGWSNPDYGSVVWAMAENAEGFTVPLWAKQQLIAPIEPAGGSDFSKLSFGTLYMRNHGTMIARRSGSYGNISSAGPGCLHLISDTTNTDAFRAAFIA